MSSFLLYALIRYISAGVESISNPDPGPKVSKTLDPVVFLLSKSDSV